MIDIVEENMFMQCHQVLCVQCQMYMYRCFRATCVCVCVCVYAEFEVL